MAIIRVSLENGRHDVIREAVGDVTLIGKYLPEERDSAFAFTRLIDDYGDTFFSSLQMRGFIPEWKIVAAKIGDPKARAVFDEVLAIAEQCESSSHVFLRFWGD